MPFGTPKSVCFICLKRFEPLQLSELKHGYQPRVLSAASGLIVSCEGETNAGGGDRNDLYARFLRFVCRYLKLVSATDRFLTGVKESGVQIQAFCENCEVYVRYVCDLYAELNAVKLHLSSKLNKLAESIKKSKRACSGKLTQGLMKTLMAQLNVKAVLQVNTLRKQITFKCKLKNKETTPKLCLHRGLFPDQWKFTYAATKKSLMVFIVIFALASASVYAKKQPALPSNDNVLSSPNRRGRLKKSVRFNDNGDAIKKEAIKIEGQDNALGDQDNDYGNDYDDGPADTFGHESDSDWSKGAPSPASVGSVGSDADFNIKEDLTPRRWNLRRKRKSRSQAETDNETGAESADEGAERKKSKRRGKTDRPYNPKPKDPLPCRKCSKTFIDTRGLSKHLLNIHGLRIDYSCPHCGMKFKKHADLQNHKRKLHKYMSLARRGKRPKETKCTKCNEMFASKMAMMKHRKSTHKIRWTKHECPICFKTIVSEERFQWHLDAHEKNITKTVNVWYCEVCGKHFYKESSLTEHMTSVHEGCYPCATCDAKYPTSKFLREHLETHETDQKVFFCSFCCRGFTNQQLFDVHRKIAHKDKQKVYCDKELCIEEFESIQELNDHLKVHVAQALEAKQASAVNEGSIMENSTTAKTESEVKCEDNDGNVAENEDVEDGTKIYSCSQCGWGFLKRYNLSLHELVHAPHNKEKKGFDCPKCGKNVRYINTLLAHYNRAHGAKVKPYKCEECDKGFTSPIWFKVHMRLHEERNSGTKFICDICQSECLDSVALSAHKRGHDPNRKGRNAGVIKDKDGSAPLEFLDRMDPASPRPDGKVKIRKKRGRPRINPRTEEETRLEQERADIWTNIPCEICDDKFENAYLVRKHMESVHETDEKDIPCCFCYKKWTLPQTYNLHLRAVHKYKRTRFECDDENCQVVMSTLSDLNEHLKTHLKTDTKPKLITEGSMKPIQNGEGEEKVTIEPNAEREEKVTLEPNAEGEEKVTLGPEPNAEGEIACKAENTEQIDTSLETISTINHCGVCNWGFLNSNFKELHELVHIEKSSDGYGHHCPRCSDSFSTTAHLLNHYNKNHGTNVKPYKCVECNRSFFSRTSQKLHIKRHDLRRKADPEANFICVDCGVKCLDANLLAKHRRKHNPDNHVTCSECGETFEDTHKLGMHMKRKHDHGEKYPCPVCGITFIYQHYIKQHMLVHEEARYTCELCGNKFKRIHTLRKHMKQHDPNRTADYICADCGMAYKSEAGLKFHIGSIHTPENLRKHPCPYCPKRYHRIMLLKMHMKTCMKAQGIQADTPDAEEQTPKIRKPRKPRGRPRQPRQLRATGGRGRKKKWEEEDDEEEEEVETTSEEEEAPEAQSSESEEEEKPDTEELTFEDKNTSELKPTSVSAINAIIANLTGIAEANEAVENNSSNVSLSSRRASSRRRSSASNNAKQNSSSAVPSSSAGGLFHATVDQSLLQTLTQQHLQNSQAFQGNQPQNHYQHWLSASAAAHTPLSIPFNQFQHDSQQQNMKPFNTSAIMGQSTSNLESSRFPSTGSHQNQNLHQQQQNTYSPNHVYSPQAEPQNLHYGNRYK